ncbi:DNA cytosine methyltransferase [Actinoplanes sp. KI2]|uniref:DNA cytosine methyltransferase n=1 Tax=Actinoplanes sp. KI2 TaxID=2983315 RepID=UPI0021D5C30D|nr:DNA cytosine methyltransferase [Actinoplanes sp. KI2]MCU7724579.1 DNA cytosine methyltransferase [Actinoplanes sp. KI2]
MTTRPRALDLFGGEGLAALGYARAGFDVTTVEIDPERLAHHVTHPHVHVTQGDATTYPLDGFDLVAGSPPCTDHSEQAPLAAQARGGTAGTGWMLAHTLRRVRAWADSTGGLFVIENVEGAKPVMGSPLVLCGTMFGLADEGWYLERHRLFESNAALMAPGPHRCRTRALRGRIIGVYGDLTSNDRSCGGRRRPGGGLRAGVERARRLMGAPWASPRGLALGIPPAYTQYLGEQILTQLGGSLAAAA